MVVDFSGGREGGREGGYCGLDPPLNTSAWGQVPKRLWVHREEVKTTHREVRMLELLLMCIKKQDSHVYTWVW